MKYGYIEGNDTIRGTDATIIFEIEKDNEIKRYLLTQVTNFETDADITTDPVPRIGTRTVGHKNGQVEYSGSMTMYYGSPVIPKLFFEYVETGNWPMIRALVENEDRDSNAGNQTMVYSGLRFNTVPLSRANAEDTMMTVDIDFTFDSVLPASHFRELANNIL